MPLPCRQPIFCSRRMPTLSATGATTSSGTSPGMAAPTRKGECGEGWIRRRAEAASEPTATANGRRSELASAGLLHARQVLQFGPCFERRLPEGRSAAASAAARRATSAAVLPNVSYSWVVCAHKGGEYPN